MISRTRYPTARGFTLIEVVAALAVFALLASVVYGIFAGSLNRLSASRDREHATAVAATVLTRELTVDGPARRARQDRMVPTAGN